MKQQPYNYYITIMYPQLYNYNASTNIVSPTINYNYQYLSTIYDNVSVTIAYMTIWTINTLNCTYNYHIQYIIRR